MINPEIVEEVEKTKSIMTNASKDASISDYEFVSITDTCIRTLLDLIRLAISEGESEYALTVCDTAKKASKGLCEYVTGMKFNELCDFMVKNQDYSDSKYDLYWDIVLEETPYLFESFMLYMEKNRPFEKKFYEPRMYTKQGRPALKQVADKLQTFADSKKKALTISMPPRVGKSTIFMFFLVWKALRNPNSHSAYGGYSGVLAKGFFKEIMNLVTGMDYTFNTIYEHYHPGHEMVRDKSMEDFTLNLDAADRFATITCRGIDGSWTGIIDISSDGVLAVDDLIRDREHSMSASRMETTWQEFLNKMVDRMNDGAQMVLIGTLWGVLDPIERLKAIYFGNPDYEFFSMSALDENDESNFDYILNGFSTAYYLEMRSRLDDFEWQAKYQQKPYVREGLLFPQNELKYFDGIVPVEEIKRVYSVTDTAVGGGDNVSAPICYEMNDGRKLICKWIYDKRTVKFTVPRVINAYKEHSVTEARVERNGVGALWVDNAQKYIKENNIIGIKLVPVSAPNRMSKEDKIKGYSDAIKENYIFLPPKGNKPQEIPDGCLYFERDADYNNAMNCLSMYTSSGKNLSDDAPDSMSQLAIMDDKKKNGQIEVIHMPSGLGL